MEVYIGNLPATAPLLELFAMLEAIVLRPDFQVHQGRDRQERGYHFLVLRTGNREVGESIIAELNGRDYGGNRLEVREYHRRDLADAWSGEERRINSW